MPTFWLAMWHLKSAFRSAVVHFSKPLQDTNTNLILKHSTLIFIVALIDVSFDINVSKTFGEKMLRFSAHPGSGVRRTNDSIVGHQKKRRKHIVVKILPMPTCITVSIFTERENSCSRLSNQRCSIYICTSNKDHLHATFSQSLSHKHHGLKDHPPRHFTA